jgi:hypothetical protein
VIRLPPEEFEQFAVSMADYSLDSKFIRLAFDELASMMIHLKLPSLEELIASDPFASLLYFDTSICAFVFLYGSNRRSCWRAAFACYYPWIADRLIMTYISHHHITIGNPSCPSK